jgi:hypothetical protein
MAKESMRHENAVWNPAAQEWFCTKCGQTLDQISEKDAHLKLEQRQYHVPRVEMPASPGH